MKKILQIMLIALLTMSSVYIFAKNGGMHGGKGGKGGMGGMGGWFNEYVLQDIGVSETVRKQIREIAYNARKDMMDGQYQIREKRLAFQKEFFKATLDEAKIETLSQEIWELQKKQHQKIEKAKIQIAKLLTGEQREKLGKLIYERKKEFWGGMRYQDN